MFNFHILYFSAYFEKKILQVKQNEYFPKQMCSIQIALNLVQNRLKLKLKRTMIRFVDLFY